MNLHLNMAEENKLEQIFERLHSLANIAGKNDKKALLASQWKENLSDYNRVLVFLLDTMVVTNLAEKKVQKEVNIELDSYPETIDSLLTFLEEGRASTDEGIAKVQAYINTVPKYKKDIIKLVTKKFRIGMTAKSLNEAVGESVINIFSCQLAKKYEDTIESHYKSAKSKGKELQVAATQKLDGFRCLAIADFIDDKLRVRFFTRKGKEIEDLDHIGKDILNLMKANGFDSNNPKLVQKAKGMVFDGELLDMDGTWASTATAASSKSNDKSHLKLHIFDGLPLVDFWNGESSVDYEARREALDRMFEKCEDVTHIELLPILLISTPVECIQLLMPWIRENGHEGLMFNTLDSKYVTKRTSSLMKVKEFLSDDLLVLDVFEGEGSFEGVLGGVVVDYKGYKVKVGSGFSLEERKNYWENKDSIIGKIIEVQYFEETENAKTDDKSLRFPTFKGLRTDKTVEDISYES